MKSIELFAGAGGLMLATANAGFDHAAVLEWDRDACNTIRRNLAAGIVRVSDCRIIEGDISSYDFRQQAGKIDFVSGGPPCQPFSIGGKHGGMDDRRNMFPHAVRAIRDIAPKAFLFENVKGLLRRSFSNYFSYIIHQLTFPEIARRGDEEWSGHNSRLERAITGNKVKGLKYNVVYQLLNAANFGVAQRRERVLIVGIRADLGLTFSFPTATHEEDALLYEKWVTGTYWDRHGIAQRNRPSIPLRMQARITRLSSLWPKMMMRPWQTVRDAIHDLPRISPGQHCGSFPNHFLNPGARAYPGHDGSSLDYPAKTLKAGDHGVPGGENMVRLPDQSVRYFSVRECARLQTFPDRWVFEGSWTESMRQLGNAVPVKMAEPIAKRLRTMLKSLSPQTEAIRSADVVQNVARCRR